MFGNTRSVNMSVWNAISPSHLALPMAVGPYCVVRFTRRFNTNAKVIVFGTYRGQQAGNWRSTVAVSSVTNNTAINAANNAFAWNLVPDFSGETTMAPSALTVQCTNPNALQTTSGIVYAGVMKSQAALAGNTTTWDNFSVQFVQTQSARVISAGRLAVRGVTASSYPIHVTPIQDFVQMTVTNDSAFTWDSSNIQPVGFAPIVFINTQSGGTPDLPLEYMVTLEYRVRYDLLLSASSAHTYHQPVSHSLWASLMQKAVSLGHGIMDIGDAVSDAGSLAVRVLGTAGRFSRGLPMLVD
jgi:hypothetical protein